MIPPKSKWCSIAIERMLARNPDIQNYIDSLTEKDASEIGLSLFQYRVSEELTALQQEAVRLDIPAYDLIIQYVADTPEQAHQMLALKDEDKYDQKSLYNLEKHDIDFSSARAIWEDSDLLEIPVGLKDNSRFVCIGMLREQLWTVLITYIDDRSHILSARRSHKEEVALYNGH
jgi:uncharacterized DUF497 family protein